MVPGWGLRGIAPKQGTRRARATRVRSPTAAAAKTGTFSTGCCYVLLSELEQDSGGCFGMHKGNALPAGSVAGNLVDEAIPCVPAGAQRRVQVGNTVTDMVNPGSAAGKKFPNGAVGISRGQQFYLGVSQ